jgi:hypothetical protein
LQTDPQTERQEGRSWAVGQSGHTAEPQQKRQKRLGYKDGEGVSEDHGKRGTMYEEEQRKDHKGHERLEESQEDEAKESRQNETMVGKV